MNRRERRIVLERRIRTQDARIEELSATCEDLHVAVNALHQRIGHGSTPEANALLRLLYDTLSHDLEQHTAAVARMKARLATVRAIVARMP